MRRILIAECIHEICSFNPVPTHAADFIVHRGEELLTYHRDIRSEVGGALKEFAGDADIEVVPTFGARGITSGGPIAGRAWTWLAEEFLEGIRKAMPVDGVYFALHGAMAAENEMDPEG